ncbi:DUF6795 domain-containing protein [Vibrio nigripulchritudo]|uniref:DUF6795 domain-containing protein n=1 Tax=Vibrio nigripulchritudo TaxID=28173 RepID=UPI0006989DC1|nr:DUF6795 domain-containing protein [Vibrio nigripulchritudo]
MMTKCFTLGFLLFLFSILNLTTVGSTELFKKRVVHLCPDIHGRLMDGDKPLSGITIERGIVYGELYKDSTLTDKNGYFAFPAHEYETRKLINPISETRVVRYLSAKVNDSDIKILYSPISTLNPIDDITRSLSDMKCDINSELGVYSASYDSGGKTSQELYSICNLEYLEYRGKH